MLQFINKLPNKSKYLEELTFSESCRYQLQFPSGLSMSMKLLE